MATNQPPEQPRGLPRAGNFDTQTEYKAKVTIRKGAIGENPRGGVVQNYTIKVSEGFAVLKAKALSFRTATEFSGARLISEDIYLKKAKGAAQSQFVPLTEENFEANLRARWGLISAGDVARWQAQGKTAVEEFVFELFVYIHRRGSATGTGIRRATAARVQEAAQAITEFQRTNQVTWLLGRFDVITSRFTMQGSLKAPHSNCLTTIQQDKPKNWTQSSKIFSSELPTARQKTESQNERFASRSKATGWI